MASGDVVFESQPFDVATFSKVTNGGNEGWTGSLRNEDSLTPAGHIDVTSDVPTDGDYPPLQMNKQYKITITEV